MLNTVKIQTELLKRMDKDNLLKVVYQVKDGSVYLTLDGLRLFVIPEKLFFIDLSKIPSKSSETLYTLVNYEDAEDAYLTGIEKSLPNGKKVTQIIKGDGETEVWVDSKLLVEFGKDIDVKVTKPNAPVYIFDLYDDETLLGLVLPVRC